MSETKGRCRAAIGLLEAARSLIEMAHTETGAKLWEDCQRDERAAVKSIERIQQRLVLRYGPDATVDRTTKEIG
jgi:hypothetical protein